MSRRVCSKLRVKLSGHNSKNSAAGPVSSVLLSAVDLYTSVWRFRPFLMGSELRPQNFDVAKFQEIIPRNPSYGVFFSWNLASEF